MRDCAFDSSSPRRRANGVPRLFALPARPRLALRAQPVRARCLPVRRRSCAAPAARRKAARSICDAGATFPMPRRRGSGTLDCVHTPNGESVLRALGVSFVGLAAVDLRGRQTWVSPSFCDLVGYSAEELLGRAPPLPYWPEEGRAAIEDALLRTIRG